MAKPKREGKGWSMRQQFHGSDLYVSGYKTSAAAQAAMDLRVTEIDPDRPPKGLGPHRTTLAQALQTYALERLKFNKGARQEADRINRYLRAVGLPLVDVKRVATTVEPETTTVTQAEVKGKGKKKGTLKVKAVRCTVTLVPCTLERTIPAGLNEFREQLKTSTAKSDGLRARLAATAVAKVTPAQVQDFIDALGEDERGAATIGLERALLRRLFNYARNTWSWPRPRDNPASGREMPEVDNERNRVMSADEERRLDEALADYCQNALVGPTLTLLTETAMRSSEPLRYATWGDVDWDQKLLKLRDSKTDKRDVPLSPRAIEALKTLQALRESNDSGPDAPLIAITYESLKAAWNRACNRAGIIDLHLHDLRHTAATRMALWSGNLFLVQALTGLKTLSQLRRYINVKATDVVAALHARQGTSDNVIEVKFPQHRNRA